jgi:hypothetical protein
LDLIPKEEKIFKEKYILTKELLEKSFIL